MKRSTKEKELIEVMYTGTTTLEQFNWDSMTTVPILSLMSMQDINYIKKLILSPRYSGNNKLKMDKIDEVMHYRGFTKFAGGTNRLVYIHPAAPNAVFKVAIDAVGISDNPAEYHNQQFLKPYCCKVFECSPCGTIASFERVYRITTFKEFYEIADDYFYILSRKILGKYVMEDIGINYFMNVGIRIGCHPVILDFPYLYELDGKKLRCGTKLDDGTICNGEIEYDDGFNKLVCKKCGSVYKAKDLAKPPEESHIFVEAEKEKNNMRSKFYRGDRLVKIVENGVVTFDENIMGPYDQYIKQMNQQKEDSMIQDLHDKIAETQDPNAAFQNFCKENIPTSAPVLEPKQEPVVEAKEVVEEPKSVELEQVEEVNFNDVKSIIHENTNNEEVETPHEPEAKEEPSDDEDDFIDYEIVNELPSDEDAKEDTIYFLINDVSPDALPIDRIKKVYASVKDPSVLYTSKAFTAYYKNNGKLVLIDYDYKNESWIITPPQEEETNTADITNSNPLIESSDNSYHPFDEDEEHGKKLSLSDTVGVAESVSTTTTKEPEPEKQEPETVVTSTPPATKPVSMSLNPMMDILKSKSNVKINLEEFNV